MPEGLEGEGAGSMPVDCAGNARVVRKRSRADTFIGSLPRIWPYAVSMGLCQGLMLIPYLLGPLGMGLGARLWEEPQYTCCFFAAVAFSMLGDAVVARRRPGGLGPLRYSLGMGLGARLWEEPQYTCCFFAAVAFSMLGDAVVARRRPGGLGPLRYSLPVALAFAAGIVLLVLHVVVDGWGFAAVLVGCLGALLMGLATACAQLSSARFIAGLPARQGVYVVLAAMVPSAVILVLAGVLRNPWAGVAFALLPVASYGLVQFALRRSDSSGGASDAIPAREVLGVFTLEGASRAGAVAGCAIALGAFVVFAVRLMLIRLGVPIRGASQGFSAVFLLGLCVLVPAVVAVACFKTRTLSMTFVFRMALPSVVAGALLAGLLPMGPGSVAGYWGAVFCAASAMLLIDQMVWITTAHFMRANPQIGDRTATRFRMLQFFGASVGAALSVPAVVDMGILETMFVGTAVLAVAFVVGVPTYEARVVSAGAVAPRFEGLEEDYKRRYSVAFARYGLTAREAEVACLLIEGLDAPHMAQSLCVSRATVNTHVRHIYEKLGVHARDEMVGVLGGVPKER